MSFFWVLLLLCATFGLFELAEGGATVYTQQISLPKKKTLVFLNSEGDKAQYSAYFNHLETFLQVEYQTAEVALKKYGEFLYENLILFGVTKDMNNVNILEFVDAGNNVIVIARPLGVDDDADDALPEWLREASIQCGVFFTDTNVVDNFEHLDDKNDHILVNSFTKAKAVLSTKHKTLLYHGLGLSVEKHNPLLVPILIGKNTAFTPPADIDGAPQAMGTDVALVVGLQTRIGSRMTFVGSTILFSNQSLENLEFANDLTKWSLQFRGVLRYSEVQHERVGEGTGTYRIRDHLAYSVKIEEFVDSRWVPFKANDIQLEFTMIDAYVRQSMTFNTSLNDGTYNIQFQAPDVYGIFKFAVDYRRAGYSPLIFSNQTTIRPLKLNEFDRYIPAAFPYYAGTFSMMGAFIVFGYLFLHLKD